MLIGLALAGCGSDPYSEKPNDPIDHIDAPAPAGGAGSAGSTGSTAPQPSGTGTPSSSGGTSSGGTPTPPLPAGDPVIVDTFDGASSFEVKAGTLTVVTAGAGKAGRLCADAQGLGHIEATIGPVSAGTYTMIANVRQDTATPGKTWTVEATSWAPGPDAHTSQGDLATSVTLVTTSVGVQSAFAATFAVKLAATASGCMLIDDIRVFKK